MQILQIQNHDFGTSRIRAILRNLLASRGREITMFGKYRFASAVFFSDTPYVRWYFKPYFQTKNQNPGKPIFKQFETYFN